MIPPPGPDLISRFCDVDIHNADVPPTRAELLEGVKDKDGLLCLLTDRIDAEVMDRAPALKVISTLSVGFEHIDVAAATARGIYVGHTPGVLTEATADLAFTLLLSAARRIAEADSFLRKGAWQISWSPSLLVGSAVWGKTLGIIGMGRIGKAVARRAQGFAMKVLYCDRVPLSPDEERHYGAERRDLETLLRESDFVTLHTPLTEETRQMIDEQRLRMMKPDAILVNTSRGGVIDEAALTRALQEGRIAGAGLDVFEKEPIDRSNPLIALPNVTLLPHIGSATREARARMSEMAAENIVAVLRGERPRNWINPDAEKVRPLSAVKMI